MTDFFIGEEVETYFPETGQRIHVGVWGLNEAQHRETLDLLTALGAHDGLVGDLVTAEVAGS